MQIEQEIHTLLNVGSSEYLAPDLASQDFAHYE